MNYTQISAEIYDNNAYAWRVQYALYMAAVNVLAEVNTTTSHAQRVTFAAKVLNGQADLKSAVIASLTNSSLAAAANANAIIDSDLQFTMNSLFNALAGIGT